MFLWRRAFASMISVVVVISVAIPGSMAQEDKIVQPTCSDRSATCLHQQEVYRLGLLTSKCKETKKVVGNMTYSICRLKGKVVSASESLTNEGDGLGYWFENGKVVAVRYFHDGNLVTFKNGKAVALHENEGSEVRTKLTIAERKNFESTAATGARSILKKFGL
jgi:hypothetical protein